MDSNLFLSLRFLTLLIFGCENVVFCSSPQLAVEYAQSLLKRFFVAGQTHTHTHTQGARGSILPVRRITAQYTLSASREKKQVMNKLVPFCTKASSSYVREKKIEEKST